MNHLDYLGHGLFGFLANQFGDLFYDGGLVSMAQLEAAVQVEPGTGNQHFELGRRYLQDAKPVMARSAMLRALRVDPQNALARIGLACCLDALGMTQTAMEEIRTCLQHDRNSAPAIAAFEYCSQKLDDGDQFAHEATRALEFSHT